MSTEIINVTMFQTFNVEYNGKTIDSSQINSEKLSKLLSYFLYQENRIISSSELIDIIWGYEDIDNPIGALKNLVYRLRLILKQVMGIEDLIKTGKSSYSINDKYTLNIDALVFKRCNQELNNGEYGQELYEKMIGLYRGRFLSSIDEDHLTLSKSAYFHSIYISRVIEYASILENEKKYEEMEILARRAISIDELDEGFYIILIKALYYQGSYQLSIDTYKETTDLLYRTLGVNPSQEMKEVYEMIKKESHAGDTDIAEIQKGLTGKENNGAFLCEYGAFRDLYNLQARMMDRLGVCTHLCVVTVNDHSRYETDKEKNRKYVENTMQKIQLSLVEGLRVGDVVSRFSVNQFVILLPVCNYENSAIVMDRTLKKIQRSLNNKKIKMAVSINEVALTELEGLQNG